MIADPSPTSQLRLDDAALYGLAGDVVRTLAPHTEADPAALLVHYDVMFGNAVGAGPHVKLGPTAHPARLHALIVGDAADARKGTAGDHIEEIFRRAEPDWYETRIARGVQSSEALIRLVDDGTVFDRRLMVYEPEFARLLATMGGGKIASTLKVAWDGKTLEATVRNERRSLRASRPNVSVIGHVQPGVLARRLPDVEVTSGFASRYLYVLVRRARLLPDGGGPDEATIDRLAERTRQAIEDAWEFTFDGWDPITRRLHEHFRTQPPAELGRTEAFRARWRELYGEDDRPGPLNERVPGLVGDVLARAAQQVIRLAVTYALADSARLLDVPHLDAAYALWQYCRASAQQIFGSLTGSRDVDLVLHELARAPGHRLTRTEISTLFQRHRSRRQLDAICDELLETAQVTHSREPTDGRTVDVYELRTGEGSERRQDQEGDRP